MQYKIKKPITIDALMRAGGSCEKFKKNLNTFMNMDFKTGHMDMWKQMDITDIVPCFWYYPAWGIWLEEKGFIETTGITYRIGQYFTHENFDMCIMSISLISTGVVNIIAHNLQCTYWDSSRLTMDGLEVGSTSAITVDEMCKMTGLKPYELDKIRFCAIVPEALEG